MTRPEAGGGDYGAHLPSEYHDYGDRTSSAWRELPWTSASPRRNPVADPGDRDDYVRESDCVSVQPGSRVQVTSSVGGLFGAEVPSGSRGQVVSTRAGVFNRYATVRFDNGKTVEVKEHELRELGWFD